MSDLLDRLNRFFGALPARLRARRGAVAIAALVVTLFLAYGGVWLRVDMSMESFFLEDDPVLVFHQAFKRTFGSDEDVYIVYEAKDGDVFSPASLAAVQRIQDCLLYTSPSPRDKRQSRMPSSA